VVLIVVAAAIVAGVVVVALGRGGEMAQFAADYAPVDLDDIDEVTATDVALLRLPRALWGYHMQATDQALGLIAQTLTDRDVEIATLLRQLAEARSAAESAMQQSQPSPPHQPLPMPPPPLAPPPPPLAPPPLAADATGAPGAAAAGPAAAASRPLPWRPSVRRREMGEQQPAMEQQSAADQWPVQAPWSAWERRSDPAAGVPDAGIAPAADPAAQGPGSAPAADPAAPAADPGSVPAPDSDPAIPRDDW
jgi:hypothetical protein